MKKGFEYVLIAFGAFFIAFGVNVFLVPCKITTGGVSGIGTVLFYFLSVPISITNIVINAVLFVFGYRQKDKKSLFPKTVSGTNNNPFIITRLITNTFGMRYSLISVNIDKERITYTANNFI